jgi:hypothetical protein
MRRLLSMSTAVACVLGLPALAKADFVPPAGVTAYRLMFVTSDPIAATSSGIVTFNDFASSEAERSSPGLPAATWSAVVSTPSISASDNVSCGALCDSSVPIYLVDGTTEIATSAAALFAGSILSSISEDESGNGLPATYVWTGSNSDGSAASGNELGSSDPVIGFPDVASWALDFTVGSSFSFTPSTQLPILALSSEIDVPEPMSLTLLGFGGAAAGLVRRFRRRRQPAA